MPRVFQFRNFFQIIVQSFVKSKMAIILFAILGDVKKQPTALYPKYEPYPVKPITTEIHGRGYINFPL